MQDRGRRGRGLLGEVGRRSGSDQLRDRGLEGVAAGVDRVDVSGEQVEPLLITRGLLDRAQRAERAVRLQGLREATARAQRAPLVQPPRQRCLGARQHDLRVFALGDRPRDGLRGPARPLGVAAQRVEARVGELDQGREGEIGAGGRPSLGRVERGAQRVAVLRAQGLRRLGLLGGGRGVGEVSEDGVARGQPGARLGGCGRKRSDGHPRPTSTPRRRARRRRHAARAGGPAPRRRVASTVSSRSTSARRATSSARWRRASATSSAATVARSCSSAIAAASTARAPGVSASRTAFHVCVRVARARSSALASSTGASAAS